MPSPAICKTASDFIGHIKKLVCHGARFSPFLGSGISAQSGILMGQEFPDYIAYTVYRVLGGGGAEPEYWDIRQRGWPPYPTSQEIDATYAFILQEYRSLIQPCEVITDHGPRKKITEIKAAAEPARTGDVELNRILVPSILRTGSSTTWKTTSTPSAATSASRTPRTTPISPPPPPATSMRPPSAASPTGPAPSSSSPKSPSQTAPPPASTSMTSQTSPSSTASTPTSPAAKSPTSSTT